MNKDDKRSSLLSFPCLFPIKIIGKASPEFEGVVVEIVRKHVPSLGEGAIEEQYSKGGSYISMTVTITATSQAQLDAIYLELTANSQVMMVL